MLEVKAVGRKKHIPLLRFQKNVGKLRHAAICIPSGKGFFIPLHDALRDEKEVISVMKLLRHTFRDWRILLRLVSKNPTHVKKLVPCRPRFFGECDACRYGLGGVWISGLYIKNPIVWRLELPDDIIEKNTCTGDITISDLEMAAHLLHFVILEYITPLEFLFVGIFRDNTPTVA